MISPDKKKKIKEFIDSLDKEEQTWTIGFLESI